MKKLNIILVLVMFLLSSNETFAQFSGRDGNDLKSCDCNKQLDSLDITFKIPNSVSAYDIIGFSIKLNGRTISYVSYNAANLKAGGTITFNLLNPTEEGLQSTLGCGMEEDKFRGVDMKVNYQNLCEAKKGTSKLTGEIVGIKWVGNNTVYKVEPNGTISAKTSKLYDSGTILTNTNALEIIHPKVIKGRLLGISIYVILALSGAISYLTTTIINPS